MQAKISQFVVRRPADPTPEERRAWTQTCIALVLERDTCAIQECGARGYGTTATQRRRIEFDNLLGVIEFGTDEGAESTYFACDLIDRLLTAVPRAVVDINGSAVPQAEVEKMLGAWRAQYPSRPGPTWRVSYCR